MKHSRGYYTPVPSVLPSVTAVKQPIKSQGAQQQAGQQSRTNFAVGQRTSDAKFENRNHKLLTL